MSRRHGGKMARFLLVFSGVVVLAHVYLYQQMMLWFQPGEGFQAGLRAGLIVLAVLVLLVLPLRKWLPHRVLDWVLLADYVWMGFALLLVTCFLAADLVQLILHLAGNTPPVRQGWLGKGALGLAVGLGVYALWNGQRPVHVRPVTVYLKKWPAALDGMKLAQLSDIHIGPMLGHEWLQRLVRQVNALHPDLVAITGDLVDGSVADLAEHVEPLRDLHSRLGTFFVTGNHEYYSGVTEWCAFLQTLGITVLRNRHVTLTLENSQFDLAGVDDHASHHFPGEGADLQAALAGRDASRPVILLAHQPVAMHNAAGMGVDLQLSGHTHGGQLWPFRYLVYLQQPVAHGLFQHEADDLQLYVSAGTGFWGPPMRLGTRAEITLLTLRKAIG